MKTIGQLPQAFVSLYRVYCWKIIQQCMLVVDNFHVKIRYTYTRYSHMFLKVVLVSCYQNMRMKEMCIYFHMFFKNSVGFVLSNCLKAKKKKIPLECEIHNTA